MTILSLLSYPEEPILLPDDGLRYDGEITTASGYRVICHENPSLVAEMRFIRSLRASYRARNQNALYSSPSTRKMT